jgi:predicted DNA binding protein
MIPDNWIGKMSSSTDATVKVLRCTPKDGGGGQGMVRIEGSASLSEERIVNHIKSFDKRNEVRFLESGPSQFLAMVELHSCNACRVLNDSGCLLDSASSRPDGGVIWNVIASNDAALTSLVDDLRAIGARVVVERVMVLRTARELTTEQERVLQTAFDMGYYDIPKRVRLEELARRLNMPKATLEVTLGRAQRKVVASRIGDA